jgi:hypothetical protein
LVHKVTVQKAPKGFQVWWNDIDIFMSCPREGYYKELGGPGISPRYVKGLEDEIRGLIAYVEDVDDPKTLELEIQFVQ